MVAAVALFLLFFLSLTSHLRPSRPEHLEFPVSLATSFAESPAAPRFVKPANLTVVGLVFYGRKSRVEMLRCYLEVGKHTSRAFHIANGYSEIWSITVAGSMRSTG